MKCSACNQEIKFCPYCGRELTAGERIAAEELDIENEVALAQNQAGHFTPDDAFKRSVMQLIAEGATQARAIREAAVSRNVRLSDSYYQYPGSHIDRWRRQGF